MQTAPLKIAQKFKSFPAIQLMVSEFSKLGKVVKKVGIKLE
jgi:hypothetical protein